MTTTADNVTINDIVWSDITEISSVTMLSGGGADIYLNDAEGTELNLELSEEAAKALRDELLALYPLNDEEVPALVRQADDGPIDGGIGG